MSLNQLNDNVTPKKIGSFNIPKSVIECKIDTLAILELLLRKNVASWEEIDEIREAVVMHLNVMYPELQLTYQTPKPLKDEAPIPGTEPQQPQKPLFYSAPPPEVTNASPSAPPSSAPKEEVKPLQQPASPPLFHNAQPPKIASSVPRPNPQPIKPMSAPPQVQPETTTNTEAAAPSPVQPSPSAPPAPSPSAPKPMFPNAGPPKILSNPPRKKI